MKLKLKVEGPPFVDEDAVLPSLLKAADARQGLLLTTADGMVVSVTLLDVERA